MFFLGQYRHNLDDKGRLTIPARYRDSLLAEGAFVMQGFDRNLLLLTSSRFDVLLHHVNAMNMTEPQARNLKRMLFSNADQAVIDRAGRILIPAYLRSFAGIKDEAIFVGTGSAIEIWSPEEWEAQLTDMGDFQSNANRYSNFNLPLL